VIDVAPIFADTIKKIFMWWSINYNFSVKPIKG
jgi:hypothetical protein